MAAIVPIADLKLIEDMEDRIDLEEARRALREVKREGTPSWDDLKAKWKR